MQRFNASHAQTHCFHTHPTPSRGPKTTKQLVLFSLDLHVLLKDLDKGVGATMELKIFSL